MSEPFLILHKVRGEPAFDIAIKMTVIDEVWWIIPTSGHRAFPYQSWPMEDMLDTSDINNQGYHERVINALNRELPPDWPDHYDADPAPKGQGARLDISALINAHRKSMEDRRF